MKKNMAVQRVEHCFVVVFGTKDPTNREWLDYLTMLERTGGFEWYVQLVFTAGGAPTWFHRRYLAHVMDGREIPVAVVSTSLRVRLVVSAMALLNRGIRVFGPGQLPDAYNYLCLGAQHIVEIERVAEILHTEVAA
jgi:hypothetical protein